MLACLLAALLQDAKPAGEPTTFSFLRYLARHQRADGSWGERPEKCTCPEEKKVVPCDAAKVAPLLRALGDENPEKRDQAEKELRALGEAALPHLRGGANDPDPEVSGRCAVLCRPFDRPAAPGGTDAELTSLALLAFLGAGYSHLSRDEYDGISFGTVVKKGLQWLLARQKENGAFDPKDPVADAVAAMALSEAYGMTASQALKDDAQKAIDRVAGRAFGGMRGTVWKGTALKSAELAELTFPKKAYDDLLLAIESRRGELGVAGFTFLSIVVKGNRKDARVLDILALDPSSLETETLYIATHGVYHLDGPRGARWRRWKGDLKDLLLPAQHAEKDACERGSWDGKGFRGRLQATALNGMNFEIY